MIIVVSSPVMLDNEAEIIHSLFHEGAELFHLRKPECSVDEIRTLLADIAPEYYSFIVLHDHYEIADEFGIHRLHLPEKKRMAGLAGLQSKHIKHFSTSIHKLGDYDKLAPGYDYIFYGPVFNSISKPGYKPVEGIITLPGERTNGKLVAIGGIDESTIDKAFEMGFDGVAVLGAIWGSQDYSGTLKRLKAYAV